MSMKFWELYVRRVHDLKPIRREELHEILDPDELIYDGGSAIGDILSVTDVGVTVGPHSGQSPKYERHASVNRGVNEPRGRNS